MRKVRGYGRRMLFVLFLTGVVFLFGMLIGNYLTMLKFESISTIEENLRVQTAGAEIQYLLLVQEPCKYVNSTPLTDELYKISERLDYMESQRGEKDSDVLQLKNMYSLLELRHWLFTINTNKECGTKQLPLLYFYSNIGDCPKCKEQGYTLTYLRKRYPDLRVYSFDINTTNPALDTIKKANEVTSTPTIIFPDKSYGFSTYDELDTLLQKRYSLIPDVAIPATMPAST